MSPFLTYLFKVGLIYSLCFLIYWILFRKETFFGRNRVFLLLSLILPALIPLIQFPQSSAVGEAVSSQGMNWILLVGSALTDNTASAHTPEISQLANNDGPGMWNILFWVYLAGFSIFFIRMIFSYTRVFRLILESRQKPLHRMILVITNRLVSPFSIFKWLVIPKQKENHPDLEKIIPHEMEHHRQRHSMDILISELMLVFQWFNPFAWMLKSSVVRNNEFLVDQTLINGTIDQKEYQYALLNNSVGEHKLALVNGFNKSLIQKRIKMMNKRKTCLANRAKEIVLIPFALILILAFSAYTNKATDIGQDQERKIVKKGQKTQERKIVKVEDTWTVTKNEGRKIVGDDTWTNPQDQDKKKVQTSKRKIVQVQDQDKKKKEAKKEHISIYVDGKMIKIRNVDSSGEDEGYVKIIKLNELEDMDLGGEIDKKKLVEKLAEFKSDTENTVLLVKESEKDGKSVDIYVGAMVTTKSDTGESGVIYIKNDDGEISVFSSEGEEKTIYVTEKDDKDVNFLIKSGGKGGEDFLIVIDGKISTEEDLDNLDADKIYSISILKSEEAVKEFGDKAKDGVIKVTTKK